MKDIVFKKDVEFNGKTYFKDGVLKIKDITEKDLKFIWSLNEQGFIEPISYKEFVEFSENLKNPTKNYRKDEINE